MDDHARGPQTPRRPRPRAILPFLLAAACLAAPGEGVQAQSGGSARSADGRDRAVRVHNETGAVIVELSATRQGVRGARIAAQVRAPIAPGQNASFWVDDGSGACLYDFVARLGDGAVVNRRSVNVCEQFDVYYTR